MDILGKLMEAQESPCVTISFNTHRTHPDNQQDGILLKKLVREATQRLEESMGKRESAEMVERLNAIPDMLNMSYNLDSMHLFVSPSVRELIKLTIPAARDEVQIGDTFAIKPLMKAMNRTENYLILLLSGGGAALYEAVNDQIIREIEDHGFPFEENPHILTQAVQRSDSKRVDNQSREYFNTIDKAVVKAHKETGLDCIVISVEENYHMLQQVADMPQVYIGHVNKHYKERQPHHLSRDAWELMQVLLSERRKAAIAEMQEAIGQSKVVTDLNEIYRAAVEGRGDMLIARTDFKQPVKKNEDGSLTLLEEVNGEADVKDITSELAMEVYGKKGRVIFVDDAEVPGDARIALKLRY